MEKKVEKKEQMPELNKKFNFKMDRVEKILSVITLVIFFISFTRGDSIFWTILFFGLAAIIFLYYFIWYRKKPAYIILSEDSITINKPIFFKPTVIKKEDIQRISADPKKIIIEYNSGEGDKNINIYSLVLAQDDMEKLIGVLRRLG
jgi:hypothetical protein